MYDAKVTGAVQSVSGSWIILAVMLTISAGMRSNVLPDGYKNLKSLRHLTSLHNPFKHGWQDAPIKSAIVLSCVVYRPYMGSFARNV